MKSPLLVISATALAALTMSCGTSPAAPSQTASFTGTWNGMSTDSQGDTIVNWALTQTGSAVSGTVTTRAVDPADGSCNSCHRNKSGILSGTISGTSLTMTMFFAAGVDGDPTPECSAMVTRAASSITEDRLTGTYSGADSCEGPFLNGTLAMSRHR